MVTILGLQRAYGEINRIYFGGKLGKIKLSFFGSPKKLGETRFSYIVIGRTPVRFGTAGEIRLNRRMRWSRRLCLTTLLHEMIHVAHPKTDCNKLGNTVFNREIRRLAQRGALDNLL